jgi:hypothetical protein
LTRKHCPKQKGRYPGFHFPFGTFSGISAQWHFAEGKLCDLQLRDSSRFSRDSLLVNTTYKNAMDNLIVYSFKVLLHWIVALFLTHQCVCKIKKKISNKKNIFTQV